MEAGWIIDVSDAARRIRCPVLVIVADRDVVTPIEEARLLAGLIPDCRFVQVDTVNHMPLAEEPAWQRIVAEVKGFLAEPVAPKPAAVRRALPLNDLTPQERNVLEGIAPVDEHPRVEFASMARVEAFYDDKTRTIFLPKGWTGRSPAELSVLVHEMVHHVQNVAGLTYACPEEREKIAYAAQRQWLALFGRDLMREFKIDPMTLLVRTNCMG